MLPSAALRTVKEAIIEYVRMPGGLVPRYAHNVFAVERDVLQLAPHCFALRLQVASSSGRGTGRINESGTLRVTVALPLAEHGQDRTQMDALELSERLAYELAPDRQDRIPGVHLRYAGSPTLTPSAEKLLVECVFEIVINYSPGSEQP